MIEALDHINLRTAQLEAMVAWYRRVLLMEPGERPPFAVPGAWLYAKGQAMVHLVEVAAPPAQPRNLALEHGAFRACGLPEFLARLEADGDRYELLRVPDTPILQVNVWDPDGNHLHVDFDLAEAPPGLLEKA